MPLTEAFQEVIMKVFIAGGSGVIGKRLVAILSSGGHHVMATTRTASKRQELRRLGAEPYVLDALDRKAVIQAVESFRPEVVVHQLTALSNMRNLKRFDEEFALTNRLRTEGTNYLLEAARSAKVRRFVAQSYGGWTNARDGGPVKTEADALDPHPPASMAKTMGAIRYVETTVQAAVDLEGTVLRYGGFYGLGTSIAPDGEVVRMVRGRKFPVFGGGTGVWSFIHVEDAAQATRIAIEGGQPGLYNIVDDEPAPVSVWLPELARIVGAKPPYRLPAWVAPLMIGEAGLSMMTKVRGASNAKAKRVLQWAPLYPSWREGFREVLAGPAGASQRSA